MSTRPARCISTRYQRRVQRTLRKYDLSHDTIPLTPDLRVEIAGVADPCQLLDAMIDGDQKRALPVLG